MLNYSPNTLFTGKPLIYLPVCTSTNTVAYELLLKNEATEGCVVITDQQTKGRGQRGNNWEAEPDKNITLSLILKPGFLNVSQQFYLTVCVSLAVLDAIQELVPNPVKIKWPNDILAEDKKLSGILIENSISGHSIQHSVVGIGLNVNQKKFSYPKATSLALLTATDHDRVFITEQLLEHIEKRYLELKSGRLAKLKYDYLQHLYRYQEMHLFRINHQEIAAKIIGVDETGLLAVQVGEKLQYFNFKEIAYV